MCCLSLQVHGRKDLPNLRKNKKRKNNDKMKKMQTSEIITYKNLSSSVNYFRSALITKLPYQRIILEWLTNFIYLYNDTIILHLTNTVEESMASFGCLWKSNVFLYLCHVATSILFSHYFFTTTVFEAQKGTHCNLIFTSFP